MKKEETSQLVDSFYQIYKLGYDAGYDASRRKSELNALRNLDRSQIEKIVKASVKPEYKDIFNKKENDK